MASDLRWRVGFGWGTVVLLLVSALAIVVFTGAARLLPIGAAVLTAVYMVRQYRKWNGRGWRQVHFRAMLAYSDIVAHERSEALQAATDFDSRRACSRLGLQLYGPGKEPEVEAILSRLVSEQGGYLAGLVERHGDEVLAGCSLDVRADIMARVRGLRFGPQLVIASVIENTHGAVEASRYALALVQGEAE